MTFISRLSPSGWCDLVKEITVNAMKMVPLLNQLVVGPENILGHSILSYKFESLKTCYDLVGVSKVGLERDFLKMQGPLKWVSVLYQKGRLHGSPAELARQVEDLKEHLKKVEDDINKSELKAEISFLII